MYWAEGIRSIDKYLTTTKAITILKDVFDYMIERYEQQQNKIKQKQRQQEEKEEHVCGMNTCELIAGIFCNKTGNLSFHICNETYCNTYLKPLLRNVYQCPFSSQIYESELVISYSDQIRVCNEKQAMSREYELERTVLGHKYAKFEQMYKIAADAYEDEEATEREKKRKRLHIQIESPSLSSTATTRSSTTTTTPTSFMITPFHPVSPITADTMQQQTNESRIKKNDARD